MPAGDTFVMARYIELMSSVSGSTDWDTNTIKCAAITSSTTPSKTDSNPCWGAGGTQNYSTNEVTAGGAYTAGGVTLAGRTVSRSGAVTSLNATSPISWAANASSPTNARWLVIYDDTSTNKQVLGYIDLGGVVSLVPGLTININNVSSGTQPLFTATV